MKVLIVIGHNNISVGAEAAPNFNYKNEYEYNLSLADLISCYLASRGHEGFIYEKDKNTKYQDVVEYSNTFKDYLHLELHCNAYNTKAIGTETLFIGDERLALSLQRSIVDSIKTKDRGIKLLKKGNRGFYNLEGLEKLCALIEPFFIDNEKECDYMKDKMDDLAHGIVIGLENSCVYNRNILHYIY